MSEPQISTPSSGNVFDDLGLSDPEQDMIKANLIHTIEDIIRGRGLSQKEAAELLGVDQGKVSALLRGKISGFSTDRLMRFLTKLGSNVNIVIDRHRRDQGSVSVTLT
ncbi:XRE family transcriptional regulator [uncultured Gammaproteobacteria bacterium]